MKQAIIYQIYDQQRGAMRISCTGCGLVDYLMDYDIVRADKIEFKHECKPLLTEPTQAGE